MENQLELLKNNSLIINKYSEKIKTIEEGIERITEIKKDYETIISVVTERRFFLEGKTLLELRELHKKGNKGDWIATYKGLGYKEMQVSSLIAKYQVANSIPMTVGMEDNLEKLSINDTKQLEKLEEEMQRVVLESVSAKQELKKLKEKEIDIKREKMKLEEENQILKKEVDKLIERPSIEIEKEVVVPPLDYESLKRNVDTYQQESEKKSKEIAELKAKYDKLKKDSELKVKELKFLQAVDGNGFKKMQHEVTRLHTILREVKAIYQKAEAQNEITTYGRQAEKKSLEYLVEKTNELISTMSENEKEIDYIEIN